MAVMQIVAGFVLLGLGGDILVRGAVAVAARLGVSTLFIGLVLVGFGTSVPELATSLNAALEGSPGIAIGNVVGSNITNILLILGITAVFADVTCEKGVFKRDAPVLAIATFVFAYLAAEGTLGRTTGLCYIVVLGIYIWASYRSEIRGQSAVAELHEREAALMPPPAESLVLGLGLTFCGIVGILFGASLIVAGSVTLATLFSVPETVIGLTIVAFGTSLPELAASISAVRRKETDLAYGNIIGSNIFNILAIIGVTAAVSPMSIPENIVRYDVWMMSGATVLLFWFAFTGSRISRSEGSVFLLLYAAYVAFLGVRSVGAL